MDSKLLENSSCASSINLMRYGSDLNKPKRHAVNREKLLKYSKILIRAVRRQISYNIYKDQLRKQMNMYRQSIILQNKNVSEENKPYYLRESSLCQINLDAKILDRLINSRTMAGYEKVRIKLTKNEESLELLTEPIRLIA